MNRLHLFEFNDQSWLPQFMTAWLTRILRVSHKLTKDGNVWAIKIRELIERGGQKKIVDLCSGGGGPALDLVRILKKDYNEDIHLTLTDLIPNLQTATEINQQNENLVYITKSINATDVPNALPGIRTIFSGFHHMPPEMAFTLLKNAFDNKQYIFAGETTHRSVSAIILYGKAIFKFFPMTKLINPTFAQSFFTFIVPILPLMLLWDNIISCLRTYSVGELKKITHRLTSDDYAWEIGQLHNPILNTPYPYIMGYPVQTKQRDYSITNE